jgi:hypothetical protein
MGSAGTQTAGLAFFGYTGTANVSSAQEYDGSTWTSGGSGSTARRNIAGSGIQTAALAFGGFTTTRVAATEEYDGSTWTGGGNLSAARSSHGGTGLQTAGLAFGGTTVPGVVTNTTEEYNGSAWTAGGNMVTTRTNIGGNGAGVQTAALTFGGYQPGPAAMTNATEEYDGTTWTSGGNLNTARQEIADAGIQTAALGFSGGPGSGTSAETESYDGSTWTTLSATLATPRGGAGGCGTATEALTFGGENPGSGYLSATEEWTFSATTTIVG